MTDRVPTRRIAFEFDAGRMPRHYSANDVLSSHAMSLASATFPEGEEFFVRSVRKVRDQIRDPDLLERVNGFIGQEVMHGRAHVSFNKALGRLGYPTRFIDRFVAFYLRLMERLLPKNVQLAITAALEHYTATFATVLLTTPEAREQFADPEIEALWVWHALEETEHKAVAFDVFREVCGNERMRVRVMKAVTFDIVIGAAMGLLISLAMDPSAWRLSKLRKSWRNLRDSPIASGDFAALLRDYNRLDFHPDDHDTTELVVEWRARLLEGGGYLASRVKGAA
ncbi:MAG: metal-dependent hydrolase [Acidimicrobiia bacterium]|nr:metal-dependent hydrolase [Acidimicrobiia bacterium]